MGAEVNRDDFASQCRRRHNGATLGEIAIEQLTHVVFGSHWEREEKRRGEWMDLQWQRQRAENCACLSAADVGFPSRPHFNFACFRALDLPFALQVLQTLWKPFAPPLLKLSELSSFQPTAQVFPAVPGQKRIASPSEARGDTEGLHPLRFVFDVRQSFSSNRSLRTSAPLKAKRPPNRAGRS